MRKLLVGLFCVFICLSAAGCGYTTSSALPANLRTVNIRPFVNKISYTEEQGKDVYFPLLEVKVRNAIEDRFLFDGNLRIAEVDTADLILSGELIGYEKSVLRYLDNDDVQEYRVQIIVNMILLDTHSGEPFWEENSFVGESTYFVTGSQASTESAAVEAATVDLARRVVERTIENW